MRRRSKKRGEPDGSRKISTRIANRCWVGCTFHRHVRIRGKMILCDWRVDKVDDDQVYCTALTVCGKRYDMFKKPRTAVFSKDDRCITTWLPTPEEIKSATEKIRSEWSDERQTTRPTHQDVEAFREAGRRLFRKLTEPSQRRQRQAEQKRLIASGSIHRIEVWKAHSSMQAVRGNCSVGEAGGEDSSPVSQAGW